jgi:hypothetical protein
VFEKQVRQTIQPQFEEWVINHATALDEAAAKDTVKAFVQFLPVTDDVAAVVGFVCHHNDYGVALHVIESADDSSAKSVTAFILNGVQIRNALLHFEQLFPGPILAAIIDDYDFVRDIVEAQFDVKLFGS